MRRKVISVILLIGLVAGGFWAYRQFLAPPADTADSDGVDVNTITVDRDVDLISAEGEIVPLRHVDLAFQMGGRVTEILVAAGEQVSAGEPLLRLEAADLEHGVTQAEIALAQAEASLVVAQTQLELAQAGVTMAEADVTAAEARLALVLAVPSAAQIAASASNVAIADAGVTQAAANRDVVLEGAADSQLRAAQAQLEAAIAERRPIRDAYDQLLRFEVTGDAEEQGRLALNAAEANVIAAQTALDTLNAGATAAQRQAAVAAVTVAQRQQAVAQAQLDLLMAPPKPAQVTVAEMGVAQAETAVSQAEAAVLQAEAAVAQAEAGVSQSQAAFTAAQVALERATLTAPFDGLVAHLGVAVGEIVSLHVPVLTLADTSGWLVETTDLTELDVVAVRVGLPVAVTVDALPGEVLAGVVSDIAAVSGLTRGDVTYQVTIELENEADYPLRWGMTGFVDIDVE